MFRDACSRHVVMLVVISTSLLGSATSSLASNMTEQDARADAVVNSSKDSRGLFSPRMEYDEWTPLGRGDPLKNDPTYDYVPPVLERVHYWMDPSSRTPDPPIPTPGLGSKEPETGRISHKRPPFGDTHREVDTSSADSRRDVYDPFFLKFIDGPKSSTQNRNNHHYHHHYLRRPSSTVSQQSNSPSSIQRTHHYIPSFPSYHSPTYKNLQKQRPYENYHLKQNHRTTSEIPSSTGEKQQNGPAVQTAEFQTELQNHQGEVQHPRPPYTMLVPPPMQIQNMFPNTPDVKKPLAEQGKVTTLPPSTTHPSVTVEQGNLVYHSTSPTVQWEEGKTQLATLAAASSQVTWKSPTPTKHDPTGPFSITTMHDIRNNPSLLYSPNVEVLPSTELRFNDTNNINYPVVGADNPEEQPWSTMVTTVPPTTVAMTTASLLTTDPLFSHYKQPVEPLRGPMYLIIQGHSKVKTYGAAKLQNSYHGIPIQDTNDIIQQGSSGNKNDRAGRAMEESSESSGKLNERVQSEEENSVKTDDEFSSEDEESYDDASSFTNDDESSTRKKRQSTLDDVIQFDDDAEEVVSDLLADQSQTSGIGELLASSLSRLKRSLASRTS